MALAIGWPAALFYDQPRLQQVALVGGAVAFALALITLGASWALGRAPRTRRVVVLHVLAAATVTALAAPVALNELLALAASASSTLDAGLSLAVVPLALVMGLPMALVSGVVFSFVALARQPSDGELQDAGVLHPHDVQPFR